MSFSSSSSSSAYIPSAPTYTPSEPPMYSVSSPPPSIPAEYLQFFQELNRHKTAEYWESIEIRQSHNQRANQYLHGDSYVFNNTPRELLLAYASIQGLINYIDKNNNEIKLQLDDAVKRIPGLCDEVKTLRKEGEAWKLLYESTEKDRQRLLQKIKDYEHQQQRYEEKRRQNRALQDELYGQRKRFDELSSKYTAATKKIDDLTEQQKPLRIQLIDALTCEKELREEVKSMKNLPTQIDNLYDQLQQAEEKSKKLEEENRQLKTEEKEKKANHDYLEVQDQYGDWYPSKIIERKGTDNIKIHYLRFSDKYDEWIDEQSFRTRPIDSDKLIEELALLQEENSRLYNQLESEKEQKQNYFNQLFPKSLKRQSRAPDRLEYWPTTPGSRGRKKFKNPFTTEQLTLIERLLKQMTLNPIKEIVTKYQEESNDTIHSYTTILARISRMMRQIGPDTGSPEGGAEEEEEEEEGEEMVEEQDAIASLIELAAPSSRSSEPQ